MLLQLIFVVPMCTLKFGLLFFFSLIQNLAFFNYSFSLFFKNL